VFLGAQNFNFVSKFFSKLGIFAHRFFIFSEEDFLTRRKFSSRLKFMGGGNCPHDPCRNATETEMGHSSLFGQS